MRDKVLVAGAAGAVGRRLTPLLIEAGFTVFGTTRSPARALALEAAGVAPVVLDVFDAQAVRAALAAIRPRALIHQLTDLQGLDPAYPAEALARNARIRIAGTQNLVAAALASEVSRVIAQSIAWLYAPGPAYATEEDALDLSAEGTRAVTLRGVIALERLTLHSPPIEGAVLRYGRFYGPGTARATSGEPPVVHVDAAAHAALLTLQTGATGIFNLVEDGAGVANAKARTRLGWSPDFRLGRDP
jgi:nucleoside-diphosphate-sugar epimerase